jgi:hypothetical protein
VMGYASLTHPTSIASGPTPTVGWVSEALPITTWCGGGTTGHRARDFVMVGLVPAFRALSFARLQDVDARDNRGHDDSTESHPALISAFRQGSWVSLNVRKAW